MLVAVCAGVSERDMTRMEMVTLLCTADRTHSQLKDLLPEKCGVSSHGPPDFSDILKEVRGGGGSVLLLAVSAS